MAAYLIGTSGWQYDHWKGALYPSDVPKKRWLEFYSRHFPTVELNASFYRLPRESAFEKWRTSTPDGFRFALKVSRFITHIKKLKDCQEAVQTFLSRARLLEDKMGPLLYQLPPGLKRDDSLLEAFLSLLPSGLEHAFEFRSPTWHDEGVFKLLRRYNAGFCIFDMPDLTTPLTTTSDFAYVRFHGSSRMYGGCYSDEELNDWAKRITELSANSDTAYIYFNNDAEGYAVHNARKLWELLGASPGKH